MARATANCTCAECGATFTKSKNCYNRTEANNWEKWAISNYTQCPTCWGKEQRKKEQETPLTLEISINPYNTDKPIILIFTGNTMPAKDSIKTIGYFWGEEPITGVLGILSTRRPSKRWHKWVKFDYLEDELQKAENIGAKITNKITNEDIAMYHIIKKENEEKQEKIAQVEKPVCPEILMGIKWNRKIYGKKGNYSLYNDGKQIKLTDDQVIEINTYLQAKKEYDDKINAMR